MTKAKSGWQRGFGMIELTPNILERSSLKEFHPNLPKKQILRVLIKRHLERIKGCKSPPLDILKSNPCYRDFLEDILNPWQVGYTHRGKYLYVKGNSVEKV
jgi:hypothetical protein